ncbi:hypothetical protein HMPREF0872_05805 [Veillonella montpellierensis DNF00314]|uniref:Rho guanine nucleotide exchange factor n=1 Tax=Veillonella montpellierensis DNF00314 TaxID=1401067 RepID=A0A096CPD3_9FIRM|nr:DUF1934 domain-containing protein [Veillonella montpellierensis]KGF47189.1 hypothetical protein HMPREF0872_05805 [Veillonella montpellierensis DNF00314]
MKQVLVSVKSIQRDRDGEDTVVELISSGRYYERQGVKYIIYNESEVTGLEGVKTTIKVYPNSVVLLRTGDVNMRHQYVLNEKHESVYQTPYGQLHMAVYTHEFNVSIQDGIGSVHLGYDISVDGEWQFYNQLTITLREDTENGYERNSKGRD